MTQIKNLVYGCTGYMGSFFKEDCVPMSFKNRKNDLTSISQTCDRHVFPSRFSLSLTESSFFKAEPSLVIPESLLVMSEPSAFMADPSSFSLILNGIRRFRPLSSSPLRVRPYLIPCSPPHFSSSTPSSRVRPLIEWYPDELIRKLMSKFFSLNFINKAKRV